MAAGSRMVVRPHRPWRAWLAAIGVPLLLAGGTWGAYLYGKMAAGLGVTTLEERNAALERQTQEMRRAQQELHEQKVLAERSAQVDRQATEELKRNLATLQDKAMELEQELAFYRSISLPGDDKEELSVRALQVTRGAGPHDFHYKVMLIQDAEKEAAAQGVAKLRVEGSMGGKAKVLTLAELGGAQGGTVAFNFRYFQLLEGELRLPEGFVPRRVVVEVSRQGRSGAISRAFEWPAAGGGR